MAKFEWPQQEEARAAGCCPNCRQPVVDTGDPKTFKETGLCQACQEVIFE